MLTRDDPERLALLEAVVEAARALCYGPRKDEYDGEPSLVDVVDVLDNYDKEAAVEAVYQSYRDQGGPK